MSYCLFGFKFAYMKISLINKLDRQLQILDHEIHVWLLRDQLVDDTELQSGYLEYLNTDEKEKYQRFYFEKHRHQYLATRVLLRCALSMYKDAPPPIDWNFSTNKYGRLYITNSKFSDDLYFNLSHTENMIALAVSKVHQIGIDVEWICREDMGLEIAEHCFSSFEIKQMLSLQKEKRVDRFFDLWTLKESYIKARGMGLSIPLDSFGFDFTSLGNVEIQFLNGNQDDPRKWFFWQFLPDEKYRLAIALRDKKDFDNYSIYIREVDPDWAAQTTNFPLLFKSR